MARSSPPRTSSCRTPRARASHRRWVPSTKRSPCRDRAPTRARRGGAGSGQLQSFSTSQPPYVLTETVQLLSQNALTAQAILAAVQMEDTAQNIPDFHMLGRHTSYTTHADDRCRVRHTKYTSSVDTEGYPAPSRSESGRAQTSAHTHSDDALYTYTK